MMNLQNKTLSNEEILRLAPSAGAIAPYSEVSKRYQLVPTINIVDMLRGEKWNPVNVQEAGTRKDERKGFQKHLIRFRHPELVIGDEAIEAVLINSHDRSCAYQFLTGVFRFICSNGMIVGDTFERVSVRHINFNPEEIIEASYQVIEHAPQIAENVKDMKAISLTESEQTAYAGAALQLVYDEPERFPFRPERLLNKRRSEDYGNSLWKTFNTVQENILKGGIHGFNQVTRKRVTTRAVKSIDRNVKLNKALWTLTEKMMELKAG